MNGQCRLTQGSWGADLESIYPFRCLWCGYDQLVPRVHVIIQGDDNEQNDSQGTTQGAAEWSSGC